MAQENLSKNCRYLTIEQAAHTLQVPYDYVDSLGSNGTLASIRLPEALGCPVRIFADSLNGFVTNCAVTNDLQGRKISRKPQNRKVYAGVFSV